MLVDTRNAKAWPRVFEDPAGLTGALLAIYEGVEPVGSDGGHLRGLYADFLDEAAALLEAPALAEAAGAYRALAQRWHELGRSRCRRTFRRRRAAPHAAALDESVMARGDAGAEDAERAAGSCGSSAPRSRPSRRWTATPPSTCSAG